MTCFAKASAGVPCFAKAALVESDFAEATSDEAAALRRLRWRARRGMLENDLILARFLDRHAEELGAAEHAALARLLDLPDGELLDLLLGRGEPADLPRDHALRAMLARLRAA